MRVCPRCAVYKAHLVMLQAENDRLKRQIYKLKQRLIKVLAYVERVLFDTGKLLAQRSGVAPRTWGIAKGSYQVAGRVAQLVKRGW